MLEIKCLIHHGIIFGSNLLVLMMLLVKINKINNHQDK